MADKYLWLKPSGGTAEKEATTSSAGATDAGKVIATGNDGLLSSSFLPSGLGVDMETVQASEALAAGDLVNFHEVGGAARVRKADASSNKPADGYVKAAVSSGNSADVYRGGRNSQVTGLTVGNQFLSATTPGAATTTVPTAAGSIVQRVGYAPTATALAFSRGVPYERA